MANVEKGKDLNGLPKNVIEYTQNIFSSNSRVTETVFDKIKAGT
jgi:hypothetical protein